MSEVIVPVAKPVVAFGRRNASEERIRQTEEEIKALTEARENPPQKDDDEKEPEGSEERTFKKRYGDLRRHSQKIQDDLQKQIDDLKEQLTKTAQKKLDFLSQRMNLMLGHQNTLMSTRLLKQLQSRKLKNRQQVLKIALRRLTKLSATTPVKKQRLN